MAFIGGHYHEKIWRYQPLKQDWKLHIFRIAFRSPRAQWVISSAPSPRHQPWHQPDDDHAAGSLWMKIFQLPWILSRISLLCVSPVDSPDKRPLVWKAFPCHDAILDKLWYVITMTSQGGGGWGHWPHTHGDKPVSVVYYWLAHWVQILVNFESKYNSFRTRKLIGICLLQNGYIVSMFWRNWYQEIVRVGVGTERMGGGEEWW